MMLVRDEDRIRFEHRLERILLNAIQNVANDLAEASSFIIPNEEELERERILEQLEQLLGRVEYYDNVSDSDFRVVDSRGRVWHIENRPDGITVSLDPHRIRQELINILFP